MLFVDLLKLSTRMFKTRAARTCLTIAGVGVGIGAVLFLVGLGYGIQGMVLEQIVSDEALLSLTVFTPDPENIKLDPMAALSFTSFDEVDDVSPLAALPGQIELNDLNANITIKAIKPTYFRYGGVKVIEGERSEEDKTIVVSEAIGKLFNIEEYTDLVGQEVGISVSMLNEEEVVDFEGRYTIVGVVEGPQSPFIYFPLKDLEGTFKIEQYEEIKVKASDSEYLEILKENIIAGGYHVSYLGETIEEAGKIFGWVRVALGFLGALSLFVAAIGMLNTMVVALLERTQEIGIMRAIGASERDIKLLFIQEATIMGFLGGLAGIVIGVASGRIFNWLLNILAAAFGGKPVNIFAFPGWFVMTIIIVSTILGFVSGFFPARKAAKLDPLEALRYK